MVILITGARAPVALDWARIAMRSGHQVWLADSLTRPLGRYLKQSSGYLSLPSPKLNLTAYSNALEAILTTYHIDLVIPTCEEIFYLAQVKKTIKTTVQWFMPEQELLFSLHSKAESMTLLDGIGEVKAPETRLCHNPQDIAANPNTILKPAYSRFGRQIIRHPCQGVLDESQINDSRPWVQQQKVQGNPICNYAVFEHGKLIAHQAYLPKYCLNQSAASYFEPYKDPRLDEFASLFGTKTQFHGQAAFDFIEESGQLYVLECNPRATSGVHLLKNHLQFSQSGHLHYQHGQVEPGRIGATLPLFFGLSALKQRKVRQLLHDYRRAQDVLVDKQYPLSKHAPWLALAEMLYRAVRFQRPLTDASTFDIEWDGPSSDCWEQ